MYLIKITPSSRYKNADVLVSFLGDDDLYVIGLLERGEILGPGGGAVTTQPQPSRPSTASDSKYGELYDQRDGKTYRTVKIGDQVWMAENLAFKPSTGKYWAYDNDPKNVATYGYLYDWETASKVCPAGWHLPSFEDRVKLMSAIDITSATIGAKMKNVGWPNDTNGNNDSGFSGLPGGYRNSLGRYLSIGQRGAWWISTESGEDAHDFQLNYATATIGLGKSFKNYGLSVRCIED